MASGITDYGANAIADHITGVASLPGGLFVALCTAQPDTGTDGTALAAIEPVGGGYARQPLARTSAAWNAAVLGMSLTNVDVAFPAASADWGQVSHYALCDSLTGGNVLAFGELAFYQFIQSGQQFTLPAGSISAAMSSPQSTVVV